MKAAFHYILFKRNFCKTSRGKRTAVEPPQQLPSLGGSLTRNEKCSFCTVADLRQVKLGEVPPLQTVGGVRDVTGDCRLTVPDRCA